METLVWMGILGVAGFMTLFWAEHKLYQKLTGAKPAEGRDNAPGLSRGQRICAGVVAGVLTNQVLSLIADLLLGDSIGITLRRAIMVVVLAVAVAVGVRVYRLLQRRVVREEEAAEK